MSNREESGLVPELTDDDRERLRAAFDRQLDVGLHHGAQLAVYVDGDVAERLREGAYAVRYLDYDWSLNDTSAIP